ncbi:MAG: hypothetical protein Q7U36_00425 [bacterium]|nr:hypothetical protein [bacterium]
MNNASDIFAIFVALWQAISFFWWIILPIMFWYIFKIIWKDFTLVKSVISWRRLQQWTFVEIIPPREIEKGPKMMETIFSSMAGVLSTYNTFDEYLKGAWEHDRFSLEIVGEEGKLHFYIRTQKRFLGLVEANIYAQYPDAEVLEVPDYTANFPKIIPNKDWDLWGTDFEFVAKGPIPIKTYDRFEETVSGEMNDPMSAIAEIIGSLGPGQHIWLQYVLQPLPEPEAKKKEHMDVLKKLKGEKVVEVMGLGGHLIDVFSNLTKGLSAPVEFAAAKKEELGPLEFRLSPGEKDLLKATEENLGRNLFKTKMRYIYLAKKDSWDGSYKTSFIGALKQFNDLNFNQFKPEDISKTYGKIFFTEPRANIRKRKLLNRYRFRNMDGVNMIFSTKELATVFHFPDMGVKSPAVQRTAGRLGSAPANLPIE